MFGSELSTHELTMSTSVPIIVDTVNLWVIEATPPTEEDADEHRLHTD